MKSKISINPPPQDMACECCGKKDMKPFGKAGDPLVGDFEGALLVKSFRNLAPKIEVFEELVASVEDWDGLFDKNKKLAERLSFYDQLVSTVSASWECRDCMILGDKEYFKILKERRENKNET